MHAQAAFICQVEALSGGHDTTVVAEEVFVGLRGGPERCAPRNHVPGHPVPLLVTSRVGGSHPVASVALCPGQGTPGR